MISVPHTRTIQLSYPNCSDYHQPLQWVKPVVYAQGKKTKVYPPKVGPTWTPGAPHITWAAVTHIANSTRSSYPVLQTCLYHAGAWVVVEPQALTWMIIKGADDRSCERYNTISTGLLWPSLPTILHLTFKILSSPLFIHSSITLFPPPYRFHNRLYHSPTQPSLIPDPTTRNFPPSLNTPQNPLSFPPMTGTIPHDIAPLHHRYRPHMPIQNNRFLAFPRLEVKSPTWFNPYVPFWFRAYMEEEVTVSGTDDSFSLRMRGTRSARWQYSAINFPTSSSASNLSMFQIEGAMYRKNPLRDKTWMKLEKYSSNMRFSNWLLSCVFLNVGAIVLIEMGNELTKTGSERRAWSSLIW